MLVTQPYPTVRLEVGHANRKRKQHSFDHPGLLLGCTIRYVVLPMDQFGMTAFERLSCECI